MTVRGPLNSADPTTSVLVGGVYNAESPAPEDQQPCALQLDSDGNLLVNVAIDNASATTLDVATGTITNAVTAVKTSAGNLYGWYIFNSNSTLVYCQFFNATTGNVTLGSTSPFMAFGIPAGLGANVLSNTPIAFSTAISIAFTTTRSGSTAPSNTIDYNFFYE